jgi:hypothetical protein
MISRFPGSRTLSAPSPTPPTPRGLPGPDDDAPREDTGRGLGCLYGTVVPWQRVRLRRGRGNTPVPSALASAQRFRRDAPVLNRALSGSSNVGASLCRRSQGVLRQSGRLGSPTCAALMAGKGGLARRRSSLGSDGGNAPAPARPPSVYAPSPQHRRGRASGFAKPTSVGAPVCPGRAGPWWSLERLVPGRGRRQSRGDRLGERGGPLAPRSGRLQARGEAPRREASGWPRGAGDAPRGASHPPRDVNHLPPEYTLRLTARVAASLGRAARPMGRTVRLMDRAARLMGRAAHFPVHETQGPGQAVSVGSATAPRVARYAGRAGLAWSEASVVVAVFLLALAKNRPIAGRRPVSIHP